MEGSSLWRRHFSGVGENGNRRENVFRQKKVTRRGDGKSVYTPVCAERGWKREISQRQEAGTHGFLTGEGVGRGDMTFFPQQLY